MAWHGIAAWRFRRGRWPRAVGDGQRTDRRRLQPGAERRGPAPGRHAIGGRPPHLGNRGPVAADRWPVARLPTGGRPRPQPRPAAQRRGTLAPRAAWHQRVPRPVRPRPQPGVPRLLGAVERRALGTALYALEVRCHQPAQQRRQPHAAPGAAGRHPRRQPGVRPGRATLLHRRRRIPRRTTGERRPDRRLGRGLPRGRLPAGRGVAGGRLGPDAGRAPRPPRTVRLGNQPARLPGLAGDLRPDLQGRLRRGVPGADAEADLAELCRRRGPAHLLRQPRHPAGNQPLLRAGRGLAAG
ncbi:hypothetical protein D3C78_1025200 [compost metagenome]